MIIYTALLLVAIFYFTHFSYSVRLISKIPGPRGLPIVHNVFLCFCNLAYFFKLLGSLYEEYGSISKLYVLGFGTVFIYNPEDIQKVLSTCLDKGLIYNFLKPWVHEGLITSNGRKWHQRRKLLSPIFQLSNLKRYFQSFVAVTEDVLRRIETEVEKDKTDLIPFISISALNLSTEISMGRSANSVEPAVINKYLKTIDIFIHGAFKRLLCPLFHPDWLFYLSKTGKMQKLVVEDLQKFANEGINEKRQKLKRITTPNNEGIKVESDVLEFLLQYEKEGKIDNDGILEEINTFIIAAFDSTATATTFMIMRMAHEPEIQQKIFKEMDNIFGDSNRSVTIEDLHQMEYLECCIKESLRLYPAAPLIARRINDEIFLSEYKIPAGTMCAINIYGLHRCPDLYPQPEKFIPERFLPESVSKRHPYSYLPFSGGPRMCLGKKFAMYLLKTMLSGIFRNFRVEPVTRLEDLEFTTHVVLKPTHPVNVRFHPRIPRSQ